VTNRQTNVKTDIQIDGKYGESVREASFGQNTQRNRLNAASSKNPPFTASSVAARISIRRAADAASR
jgi:hypothetical protein